MQEGLKKKAWTKSVRSNWPLWIIGSRQKEGFPVEELSGLSAKGWKEPGPVELLELPRETGSEGSWWEAQCQPRFWTLVSADYP